VNSVARCRRALRHLWHWLASGALLKNCRTGGINLTASSTAPRAGRCGTPGVQLPLGDAAGMAGTGSVPACHHTIPPTTPPHRALAGCSLRQRRAASPSLSWLAFDRRVDALLPRVSVSLPGGGRQDHFALSVCSFANSDSLGRASRLSTHYRSSSPVL